MMIWALGAESRASLALPNPVIYVEQVPVPAFRTTDSVVSIGGTHLASASAAPRGGGLMIRYPDSEVRDLTAAAGYGASGALQDGQGIAVRDPAVHWNGTKVLFSMVVGSPSSAADRTDYFWQLYEITGLGADDTPVVTKVPGQPENRQNIQGTYGTDGRIIFVSDQPLDGYGASEVVLDERGTSPAVTGVWSLDPADGSLLLLEHSPSGSFAPMVDSFGRVVFSRWDHLQRDGVARLADAIDYHSESSATASPWQDMFPEPLEPSAETSGHRFDQFLPWTVNEDGSALETMNHLGRHELSASVPRARIAPRLVDFTASMGSGLFRSQTRAGSFLQIAEDPLEPGRYVATDAASHAVSAGRLIAFSAAPGANPDHVEVQLINREGATRDPNFLADGRLMASLVVGVSLEGSYGHVIDSNGDTEFIPPPNSPFTIAVSGMGQRDRIGHGALFSAPRSKAVEMYLPNAPTGQTHFSATVKLWQLQAVELVARPIPESAVEAPVAEPELAMFAEVGVEVEALRNWLVENNKALLVARDITSRDRNDQQQPFDLSVYGVPADPNKPESLNPVASLGFFQGDYVREYPPGSGLPEGRRIVARPLHDGAPGLQAGMPAGQTRVAQDGSMAMIVPAGRAVTWQLQGQNGEAVVRERYWLSFRAGEIRTCTSCHAVNTADQYGGLEPVNSPLALRDLLTRWRQNYPDAASGRGFYELWAEVYFGGDTNPMGDPDGDGLANLPEFVYGTDPGVAHHGYGGAHGLKLSDSHQGVVFTRSVRAKSVRISVEHSQDLQAWVEVATLINEAVETDGSVSLTETEGSGWGGALWTVEVRPTEPDAGGYYRLRFRDG